MKPSKKLVLELKKLNQRLDQINYKDRFMIYNANPFKFALFNFLAGIFHSLGTLFGTAIIAALIFYIFSNFNFIDSINNWLQNSMSQIKWESLIPTPSVPPYNLR